ncbi:hypothetical protein RQV73_001965 [Vibrio fluvialis]|nr:hypothetical protein [Vibrio fluvialis]
MKKQLYFIIALVMALFSSQASALIRITYGTLSGQVFESPSAFVSKYTGVCHLQNGLYYKPEAIRYTTTVLTLQGASYSNSSCSKVYSSYVNYNISYSGYTCPEGTEFNPATNSCAEPPSRCEILKERGEVVNLWWSESKFGSSQTGSYYCSSYGCASQIVSNGGCAEGKCFGTASLTGGECSGSGESSLCTDSSCTTAKQPNEPDPNDPTPEPDYDNPIHDPDDPTSPVDSGGNVANPDIDPSTPDPVDPAPEVTPPETGEATDAIVNMNRDVNKALNDLNIDINSSNTKIENELKLLNASNEGIKSQLTQLEETTIKIGDNNKALITQLNRDVTTAVNINTNAVNKLGGKVDSLNNTVGDLKDSVDGMATDVGDIKESVSGMGETLDGMADDLSGIGDAIDGLANIDGEGLRQGTCFSNPQYTFCKGWYEPNYPDGFRGVFDEQFGQLTDSVTASVNNIFGGLDLSNSAAPSFCLTLWMFGTSCFTDYLDLSWVFGFIRFAFMFTTVWLCRKLVFGG